MQLTGLLRYLESFIWLLSLTVSILRTDTDIHHHVAFPGNQSVCLQRSLSWYSKSTAAVQDCLVDEAKWAVSYDTVLE